MGTYVRIVFTADSDLKREMLIADLINNGFESIEEKEQSVILYVPAEQYDKETIAAINPDFTTEEIPDQNWNAIWEQNFEPVVVSGFCTIRADFHKIPVTTPYEVIITPKMSFGTGHHATTQLMAMQMQQAVFTGKSVLDFGTGTGILAILAEKLGADRILAIDNDEWSYKNALENAERNGCCKIDIRLATLNTIDAVPHDLILANINRHILLEHMSDMYRQLAAGGTIIMSGLLLSDRAIIESAATAAGFLFIDFKEMNGWICLEFSR